MYTRVSEIDHGHSDTTGKKKKKGRNKRRRMAHITKEKIRKRTEEKKRSKTTFNGSVKVEQRLIAGRKKRNKDKAHGD